MGNASAGGQGVGIKWSAAIKSGILVDFLQQIFGLLEVFQVSRWMVYVGQERLDLVFGGDCAEVLLETLEVAL